MLGNEYKGERIGLLGGSFDPIHYGHLSLAIDMMESHALDAVWLVPLLQSSFGKTPHALPHHRMAMVRSAIAKVAGLRLEGCEMKLPTPSYTINTLRYLHSRMHQRGRAVAFFLILGEDAAATLPLWHEVEEVIRLATPLIGKRVMTTAPPPPPLNNNLTEVLQRGATKTRLMEITSTEIRQRIAIGARVDHLLPRPVLKYIKNNHLYMDSNL